MTRPAARIDAIDVSVYVVPTDRPESDGTLEWDKTTLVLVEARGGGKRGLGWTYADRATASVVKDTLAKVVVGQDALDTAAAWQAMTVAVRNLGRCGIAAMAISAVDNALWDLKARLVDLPLHRLLGAARDRIRIYGSGGFTSYSVDELREQLGGWAARGIARVKMKVGRRPDEDVARVQAVRRAIGDACELFVDANGAYGRRQALALGEQFAALGVTWFEEPVSSDDLEGLAFVRRSIARGVDVTAGEYGYTLEYFRDMLAANAVDVVQPDVTRAGGVTAFVRVGALCDALHVPLSAHCAPQQSAHVCCAVPRARHLEYFHDHARIERLFFDGALDPEDGELAPDPTRAGFGVELKRADAARYAV